VLSQGAWCAEYLETVTTFSPSAAAPTTFQPSLPPFAVLTATNGGTTLTTTLSSPAPAASSAGAKPASTTTTRRIIVRRVQDTERDRTDIRAMSKTVYVDPKTGLSLDYANQSLDAWLSPFTRTRNVLGLEVEGRLVGLVCETLIDEGRTLWSEALRIHPDYRKQRLNVVFLHARGLLIQLLRKALGGQLPLYRGWTKFMGAISRTKPASLSASDALWPKGPPPPAVQKYLHENPNLELTNYRMDVCFTFANTRDAVAQGIKQLIALCQSVLARDKLRFAATWGMWLVCDLL
jgi:hypothetical protein